MDQRKRGRIGKEHAGVWVCVCVGGWVLKSKCGTQDSRLIGERERRKKRERESA